jgi:uncharacterized protein (TIRG00374 family)
MTISVNYVKPGLKLFFKVLFSIAFFAILFSFVKGNELLEVVSGIHWGYFCLSFALTPVLLGVSCTKWKLILDKSGIHVPLGRLLRIYFIGYFFSNILPSTVGGDVVRSYYAGRQVNDQAYAAVSVFLERFTGILFLFVLVIIMPLLRLDLYAKPYVYLPAIGGFTALFLVCAVGLSGNSSKLSGMFFNNFTVILQRLPFINRIKGLSEFLRRITEIVAVKMRKVRAGMKTAVDAMRSDSAFLVQIIVLTMIFYLFTMVNVYVSFKAFNVEVNFLAVCVLVPTALFMAHFPVTVLGNLGYFESVFVGYFLLIGVPGAESLAMGLLLRLKMLTLGVVGMGLYIFFKSSSRQEVEEMDRLLKTGDVEIRPGQQ